MAESLIESEIARTGNQSSKQLPALSERSCELSRQLHWVESRLTSDEICGIYIFPGANMVRQHSYPGTFSSNDHPIQRTMETFDD